MSARRKAAFLATAIAALIGLRYLPRFQTEAVQADSADPSRDSLIPEVGRAPDNSELPTAGRGVNMLKSESSPENSRRLVEEPEAIATSEIEAPVQNPRVAYQIQRLQRSYADFLTSKDITTSFHVLASATNAWAEFFDTTIPVGEDKPNPKQILNDQQWEHYIADRFGGRRIVYTRADFPEYWELRAVNSNNDRQMFDISLDPDLLARIEERVKAVLDTVQTH